jgi:translation initiation factor 2B subunit (eIF-2B alpha/beta/delta family)
VPVLVAAESYKFSDKVQLDSIVFNELGSGAEIASMQPAGGLGQGSSPSEAKGGGSGEGGGDRGDSGGIHMIGTLGRIYLYMYVCIYVQCIFMM